MKISHLSRYATAALIALLVTGPSQAHTQQLEMTLEKIDFSDVTLQNQNGVTLSLKDEIIGQNRLVITFQFTACKELCVVSSSILSALEQRLPVQGFEDVRLLSITLDPEADSPEVLLAKASEFAAGPRWLWLTGQPDDLELLYRRLGISGKAKESHDLFFLVGRGGDDSFQRISGVPTPELLLERLKEIGR